MKAYVFGTELAVIGSMLLINAVFAAFEMALASITHGRLVSLARQNKKGATSALAMKENMEGSLAVIQLGITLVGAIAAATGGHGMGETLEPYLIQRFDMPSPWAQATALILFVIPLSAVTIVIGELVPKMVGLEHREGICLALSPFMRRLAQAVSPIVRLFESITRWSMQQIKRAMGAKRVDEDQTAWHELHAAVGMARTARLIGAHEEKILLSAAQLSVRPIREIILPAKEISMLPTESSLTNALLQAHLDLHTRFPVCRIEDDPQTIEGYVTFKDIVVTLKMNPTSPSLRSIVRPIRRLPADQVIARILEQMIQEKIHIALVESPSKEILGLVTLEDILEELVGSIEDEFDRLPNYTHATEAGWIVGGGLAMPGLAQLTQRPELAVHGSVSLAQWCVQILGRPVQKGEVVNAEGLTVIVRKLRRHQVSEAFVRITDPGPRATSSIPA